MRVASLASSTEWSLRIKPVYIKLVTSSIADIPVASLELALSSCRVPRAAKGSGGVACRGDAPTAEAVCLLVFRGDAEAVCLLVFSNIT